MHKKLIPIAGLLLALSILAQSALAGHFTVSGKVAYHDPNMAVGPGINDDLVGIPGAVITFVPGGVQPPWAPPLTVSDSNGDYEITIETTDEEGFFYDVNCQADGYTFEGAVVYEENTPGLLFIAQ